MRFDYFSITGYVSVLLCIAVALLWFLHMMKRPRRWLCHIAFALAVVAYVFAEINSQSYVERIQPEQERGVSEAEARLQANRKLEQQRSEHVAQVRFAEDDSGDFLDMGGMDEADLKYMGSIMEESEPEWQKEKKKRGELSREDDSIEAMIGAKTETKGVDAEAVDEVAEREPLIMPRSDFEIANMLDRLNLRLIRLMIFVGLIIIVVDYLRRVNIYEEAYLPLPLPASWSHSFTPIPPRTVRPTPPRRSMSEELEWLAKRGDSFVYMNDDPSVVKNLPPSLSRLGKRWLPLDLIRVGSEAEHVSDEFIFEAVWYGRASFALDSSERAIEMLGDFMDYMAMRKSNLAKVARTVYLIWDCDVSLDEAWQEDFAKLAQATGMSLVICPR